MIYKLADVIWNDDGTIKSATPLEALEKLKQNNKDNTHLFDGELLDIIEKELILSSALRNKINHKVEAKEYRHEASNSYRSAILLTYDLKEQWNDEEIEALTQFLLNLSGISKKLKALEIIKRNTKIVDYSEHNGVVGEEFIIFQGFRIKTKQEYDLLKEVFEK